ncbi:MAG: IclR family transcriptional regulator [Burkholderiaceae bacterium]|nr:IclR family transcriptional regulator [Burkholderiaceae bacterium]
MAKADPKKDIASEKRPELKGAVGSLQKGLCLVELLLESLAPVSLTDLAAISGFDTSSTHRLLQTLIDLGYAAREENTKRYMAGPRALSTLRLLHPISELRRTARPILESLRDTSGQTTTLIIFVGDKRMTVDVARGAHQLVPYYDTWLDSPLHASATGKILVAWKTDKERAALLGNGPYEAVTPKTAISPAQFAEALSEVRQQGYSVGRDEPYLGITSMAAPLMYSQKILGCLAITARSDAITSDREKEIGFAMRTSASLLSHSGPDLRSLFFMFNSTTNVQQVGFRDESDR